MRVEKRDAFPIHPIIYASSSFRHEARRDSFMYNMQRYIHIIHRETDSYIIYINAMLRRHSLSVSPDVQLCDGENGSANANATNT